MIPALILLFAACDNEAWPDYFTDADTAPKITSVSPDTVPTLAAGTQLTIAGSNLSETRTVVVGSRNATVLSTSDTAVLVSLPDGAPGGGPVDVGVVTDDGWAIAEGALNRAVDGADWWANEVASMALYAVSCPPEGWGYDPSDGSWYETWWCGVEMGYADAYAFYGAGRQPGFAGDLAGFDEVSYLPAIGDVRVYGPTDRRPPVAPMLYGIHPEDESLGVLTPRDFDRDLDFLEALETDLSLYYIWYDDVAEHVPPVARLFNENGRCIHGNGQDCVGPMSQGDTGCVDLPIDLEQTTGDLLYVDGDATGAAGVTLGFAIGEDYGYTELVYTHGFTSSVEILTDDGTVLGGAPTGAELQYDGWSGWYWKEGVTPYVLQADLPDADYTVRWKRLGVEKNLGTVRGVAPITSLRPDLMTGDNPILRTRDLEITWDPVVPDGTGDPSYLVFDLRVYDGTIQDPNWMTEVYRIVARGDDATGMLTIPADVLTPLPLAFNMYDENYDNLGYWAELTVARHQFRKVPITETGDLVIDFMSAVDGPVRITGGVGGE